LSQLICFGILIVYINFRPAFALDNPAQLSSHNLSTETQGLVLPATVRPEPVADLHNRADFKLESASADVLRVSNWIMDTDDNHRLPFIILDNKEAKVFVFHADGRLLGAAPALLGLALGDDTTPGVGDRKLSEILPNERTTPAGRFVAVLGRNLRGKEILWVDYNSALSLHRVVTGNPKEHRAQRLSAATPLDKRITYGCINVSAKFYEGVVSPAFTGTNGIVYILPETKLPEKVFGFYSVN
jgi:hypothetical protein